MNIVNIAEVIWRIGHYPDDNIGTIGFICKYGSTIWLQLLPDLVRRIHQTGVRLYDFYRLINSRSETSHGQGERVASILSQNTIPIDCFQQFSDSRIFAVHAGLRIKNGHSAGNYHYADSNDLTLRIDTADGRIDADTDTSGALPGY